MSRSIRSRPVGRRVLAFTVVALLMVPLGSCTGADETGGPSPTDDIATTNLPPVEVPPAPTCTPSRPAVPGTQIVTITSGDQARQYLLSVPAGYDGSVGAPLLLDFHDTGFTAPQHEAYTLLPQKGAAVGYVVATLQASPAAGGWQLREGGAVDDFAFTDDVVAQIRSTLCVDPARAYAVGYGVGALFTSLLACRVSTPLAAIGLVAGQLGPSCDDGDPVSVMALHGTADQVVPYGGQDLSAGAGTVLLPGAEQAMANWAAHDDCATDPVTESIGARVQHLSWLDCALGAVVTLYAIDGAGHTWPGGTRLPSETAGALGAMSTEVVATDLLLAFFALHPGPPA